MKSKKIIYCVLPFFIGIALTLFMLIYNANKILKYEFEKFLGKGFSAGNKTSAGVVLRHKGARMSENAMPRLMIRKFMNKVG